MESRGIELSLLFKNPIFIFKTRFFRSLFYSIRGKHFKVCDDENGLPRHVIENIANGQKWLQGDTAFHRRITAPTLLVHGLQDKHVTLVQECEMERVRELNYQIFKVQIITFVVII